MASNKTDKLSRHFLFCYCVDFCLYRRISHYTDVIMGAIASQITSLMIVYSIVYSDADQRKHQRSASQAFLRGIHRGNSTHKWPVTRKMFPFDDVIMSFDIVYPKKYARGSRFIMFCYVIIAVDFTMSFRINSLWPLSLTLINFNHNMDK